MKSRVKSLATPRVTALARGKVTFYDCNILKIENSVSWKRLGNRPKQFSYTTLDQAEDFDQGKTSLSPEDSESTKKPSF